MRGFRNCGLDLTLNLKDKEAGEINRLIEGVLDGEGTHVKIHIVDRVSKKGHLEEPWFHIEATPHKAMPKERTCYDIELTREKFRELTNPKDPITTGGYLVSRCQFDRVDIKYFGV